MPPKAPENLVTVPGPARSHMVFIDCDTPPLRAQSYRVLIKRDVVYMPEAKSVAEVVFEAENPHLLLHPYSTLSMHSGFQEPIHPR